ncbi:hypothetical protein OG782_16935 [Streptomyces sp. NBC_00876]|uniref:hypothetical protein n=1 Tax=Streptomyces sp. NBC_00876 TaxID=2975853 RepID=UPI0038702A89|nr:hypothetical protein OG782_16935 [Streptomyces sp. NBC_00876]
MRTRSISTATWIAVLFSSAALVGGAANPAAADTSKIIPAASVGAIGTDGVHHRVFISDPNGGKVVVATYNGTVMATIPSLPGRQALVRVRRGRLGSHRLARPERRRAGRTPR